MLASQWASGATWSLALTIGQAASCGVIFVLALRRGVGGVSPVELVLLGIAALGIVGWQIADDPTVATCSVVVADIIGVALMLPKTYRAARLGDALDVRDRRRLDHLRAARARIDAAALLIYPVYILIADAAVVAVIVVRRRALALAV